MDLALAAVLRQPDNVLHGLCADGFSSACHRQQRRNRACSDGHAFVLAGDFQLGSAADDRDVQFALDLLDVFVKCTEYCHQQFSLLDLHYLFYGYTLLNSSYIIFVGRGALTPPNVDSSATFIP